MRRKLLICVLTFIFLSACVKPYVGEKIVNYNPNIWCAASTLPKRCMIETEHFIFQFEISRTGVDNEYELKGTANYKSAGGALRIDAANTSFSILVTKDHTVTDNIIISQIGEDLGTEIILRKKFTTEPFEWVTFIYNVRWVS